MACPHSNRRDRDRDKRCISGRSGFAAPRGRSTHTSAAWRRPWKTAAPSSVSCAILDAKTCWLSIWMRLSASSVGVRQHRPSSSASRFVPSKPGTGTPSLPCVRCGASSGWTKFSTGSVGKDEAPAQRSRSRVSANRLCAPSSEHGLARCWRPTSSAIGRAGAGCHCGATTTRGPPADCRGYTSRCGTSSSGTGQNRPITGSQAGEGNIG